MSTELSTTSPVNQVVFVLSNVADWQTLLGSVPAGAEVHLLDATGDALGEMASILANRSGLDAIHLVSHGSSGSLSLGTTTLNTATLSAHESNLARIGAALGANGDLLLYGCDVAAGSTGSAFIDQLAQATGADVAASTDPTGAANLGGDWILEASTGVIETASIVGTDYAHTLVGGNAVNWPAQGQEDGEFLISFSDLVDQSGITGATSFTITNISGNLSKANEAVSNGVTVSTGESLTWNPPQDANGSTVAAFRISFDGSSYDVIANVAAVNDAPTLGVLGHIATNEDIAVAITHTALATAASGQISDVEDGSTASSFSYQITAINSGKLELLADGTWTDITASVASTPITLSASTTASYRWTPAADANGTLDALTIKAVDSNGAVSLPVTLKADVTAVNDAPLFGTTNGSSSSGTISDGTTDPNAAVEIYNNGDLRFGNGSIDSIDANTGMLQQPFYSTDNGANWYKLTFSEYRLNFALGVGGTGTNVWNTDGTVIADPTLSSVGVDTSGFSSGSGTTIHTGTIVINGATLKITEKYELPADGSYVKVTTQVTNIGETAANNIRLWVGTQDDYIGNTDSPSKIRGNIVDGAFVPITDATTQTASAIKVYSGSEQILFYSTSDRANTMISMDLGWNSGGGVVATDPNNSDIAVSSDDGSYALYLRMNDLAAGASDSLTWFYAAGASSSMDSIVSSVSQASTSALTETNAPLTDTGTLPITDIDSSTVSVSVTGVQVAHIDASGNPLSEDPLQPSESDLLAMMSVATTFANNTGSATWTFDSGRDELNEGFNYLNAGEQLVLTYTLTATDGSGASSTTTATITIDGTNDVPTITSVTTLDATEDTPQEITYADLAAAANDSDLDGDAISFRIESVTSASGTLQKWNGSEWTAVTAGTTTLSANEKLLWTPTENANGLTTAFTVKAYDGTAYSATAVDVKIDVTPANDAPTFQAADTGGAGGGGGAGDGAGESGELISTYQITEGPSTTALEYASNTTYKVGFYVPSAKDSAWTAMKTYYETQAPVVETVTYSTVLTSVPAVNLLVAYLPNVAFTAEETGFFQQFLDAGGRIFFVGENQSYAPVPNANITSVIAALGGSIAVLGGAYADLSWDNSGATDNLNNSTLLSGVDKFSGNYHAQLQIDSVISQVVMTDDNGRIVMADQALSKGRVTVIADENWLTSAGSSWGINATGADNLVFLKNILIDSANNQVTVAGGGNPNEAFSPLEGLIETDAGLTQTGTVTVNDIDSTDTVTVGVSQTVGVVRTDASGNTMDWTPSQVQMTALKLMLSVSPSTVITPDSTTGNTTWTFDSGIEAFNYLAAGEKLELTYTLEADDGQGGTATQDVVITINGTDDKFAFNGSLPPEFTVTEDVTTTLNLGAAIELTPDPDGGSDSNVMLKIQTGAGKGILHASNVTGVTVSGSGTGTLLVSGNSSVIASWIAGGNLTYTGAPDLNGNAADTVTVKYGSWIGGTFTELGTANINISPANDAPITPHDLAITAAAAGATGSSVSELFSTLLAGEANLDSLDRLVVVADASTAAQGNWEYSADGGTSWTAIGDVSSHKLALSLDNQLRFVASDPNAVTAGDLTIQYTRILAQDANVSLTAVDEDSTNPTGDTVANLFGSSFYDIDTGDTLGGIVIVADASTTAQGKWQYSSDGTNWFDVGRVSTSAGLVLDSSTMLRFLPLASTEDAPSYAGTPGQLTGHLVDSSYSSSYTTGTTRATFNTTTDNASSPVSATGTTLSTAVNDIYIDGTPGVDSIIGTEGDDTIRGYGSNDTLVGGLGNDSLKGMKGDDSLLGGEGNDTLDGGLGNDTLDGGDGDNVFYLDSPKDSVIAGDGIDTVYYTLGEGIYVQTALTYKMGSKVENLVLAGNRKLTGIGNELDNRITGNAQDNILDGKGGKDTLIGGAGNDTYIVDSSDDTIEESYVREIDNEIIDSGGIDSVESSASYVLSSYVEILTLRGSDNIDATGNDGNNRLTGNIGNNKLDGGQGADTLAGLAGNDTYYIDNVGDVISEATNSGTDLVLVGFEPNGGTYTLGANVENASLVTDGNYNLKGNELNNLLTGNEGENSLTGAAGNDTLDGGAGQDSLDGGAGNDIYYVDHERDIVTETSPSNGVDTVRSSVSFSIGNYVENLELSGTDNVDATGNALANRLTGNEGTNKLVGGAGNDTLDGGAGADVMEGGAGNDVYFVDNYGDTVEEINAVKDIDLVYASVSFDLGNYIENLTLTGDLDIDATGNELVNILTGNGGDNRLDGREGADMMAGGAGNDTYVVDNGGDKITEKSNAGNDLVEVTINTNRGSYTLSDNVENGRLNNSVVFNLIGNALANELTGNAWDNLLDGGAGADDMIGGAGNDIYVVDNIGDRVTEASGAGTDLVRVAFASPGGTYSLAENVENAILVKSGAYNLSGNELSNQLVGNAQNNLLDGGAGADDMIGGAGNDIYVIDNTADRVTEASGAGTDLVRVAISNPGGNYTLADNVENATLVNTVAYDLTGNGLANLLTGNAENNRLDGGSGSDTLIGGAGADVLIGGAGSDTFRFSAGDSGQTSGIDKIDNFTKGALRTGDLIDYSVNLSLGGSAVLASTTQAMINQSTGVATFASGSGRDLGDALDDITARFTAAKDSAGEFAFFKVANTGNFYLFVSDGIAGVTNNDVVVELVGIEVIKSINLSSGNLSILS